MNNKCDKCGKIVKMANDVALLESFLNKKPFLVLLIQSRHLFPTHDCEGSPSRAQYFTNKVKSDYKFVPEYKDKFIEARKKMIEYVISSKTRT